MHSQDTKAKELSRDTFAKTLILVCPSLSLSFNCMLEALPANPIKLGVLCMNLKTANIQSMAGRSVYFSQ